MTSIAGITIQGASASIAQLSPVSAAVANTANTPIASTTNATANASLTAQASSSSGQQSASISPQIVVDPVVGVITKYVDGAGKVISQFPSAVAVAYLRAGLDPDGFRAHPPAAAASSTVHSGTVA
jgi:hypothetical protein